MPDYCCLSLQERKGKDYVPLSKGIFNLEVTSGVFIAQSFEGLKNALIDILGEYSYTRQFEEESSLVDKNFKFPAVFQIVWDNTGRHSYDYTLYYVLPEENSFITDTLAKEISND